MKYLRTCNQCGWVHVAVTREFALKAIDKFNAYFDSSSEETKAMFGNRRSSIKQYDSCNLCGGSWSNFREFKEGDCPVGVTIGPIIYYNNGDDEEKTKDY